MPDPFVKIENLEKEYQTPAGSLPVLRGIDLEINQGDFIAIVGPSGSGKTTLLNMISAVDRPTAGSVLVANNCVTENNHDLTKWRARHIGIIFQFFQLLPTLTVVENVMFPMDYADVHRRSERRKIALEMLDKLDIKDQANKTPDMLSGGQHQRAAIARGLANHPPLLIGDEPTSALDFMNSQNVFELFAELSRQGTTVIAATYDYEIVRNAPKVLELKDGVLHPITLEKREESGTQ